MSCKICVPQSHVRRGKLSLSIKFIRKAILNDLNLIMDNDDNVLCACVFIQDNVLKGELMAYCSIIIPDKENILEFFNLKN